MILFLWSLAIKTHDKVVDMCLWMRENLMSSEEAISSFLGENICNKWEENEGRKTRFNEIKYFLSVDPTLKDCNVQNAVTQEPSAALSGSH